MPKLKKVPPEQPPPKRSQRGSRDVPGKSPTGRKASKSATPPTSPISGKKPPTPPSANTRSGRAKTAESIAAPRQSKGKKHATPQKGKKRLKTMASVHEESDEGQSLLSPPTASRKTAAPSPMAAAAAGTLAYLNLYGSERGRAGEAVESEEEYDLLEDGNVVVSRRSRSSKRAPLKSIIDEAPDNDEDDKEPADDKEDEDDDDLAADGLDFSDDDDALGIQIDSEDELRTSFPKNKLRKNMILGGPKAPDPAGLTEDEYQKLYTKFRRERKRYTDKKRTESAKRSQVFGGTSGQYSGCCDEQLRSLNEVDSHPLETGHTFPGKDILHLHLHVWEVGVFRCGVHEQCKSHCAPENSSGRLERYSTTAEAGGGAFRTIQRTCVETRGNTD